MTAIKLLEKFCKKGCKAEGHCDWPLCNVTLALALLAKPCECEPTRKGWTGVGYIFCPFCGQPIEEIR